MQRVGAQPVELSVEGRNVLSVADKNAVGRRRAAWRVITSVEPKNKTEAYEQQAADAKEYAAKVCDGILTLMDENCIPLANTGEPKVFFCKVKGDYYRFLASKVAQDAANVPVVLQKQAQVIQKVPKTVEVPKLQYIDEIVDEPVVMQGQVPTTQTVKKTVEVPQGQFPDRVVDVPVVMQRQDDALEHITRRRLFIMNDCDELIPEWLNVVKSVVASENLPLNIYRETLLQNKILRMIKKSYVTNYLEMLAEIAEQKDDRNKFYEQFVKCMKLKTAEMLRFNTSKPGDERINFKEYVDRMKKGQNDVYDITGKSIVVVSSSSFLENLRKNGYEVPYMADPVDEYTAHRLEELDGTKLKPTMKEGLDSGDHDEEQTLEELNIESELGDKVDEVIVSNRKVDVERVRQHTGAAAQHRSTQQHNNCHRKQWKQPRKKEEEDKGQEGRKKEEEKEAEEGGGEQVKKDVTDWVGVKRRTRRKRCKMVQIFVKVNGSKATPIEVNLTDDRVEEDIMRQVQNDEDAYVTMQGKVLKTSEKLKSCGVTDGCTIQVTSRMRGGGKHKDKMSKGEKKQVAQLDDGMCAMACEQTRLKTESVSTLQSTDEEKRRLAEEVEKVRKAMASMGKEATGGYLQRVAEMEESFKKLEKKVQAKDVDEQEMMTDFENKVEKKVVREGRGCTESRPRGR